MKTNVFRRTRFLRTIFIDPFIDIGVGGNISVSVSSFYGNYVDRRPEPLRGNDMRERHEE